MATCRCSPTQRATGRSGGPDRPGRRCAGLGKTRSRVRRLRRAEGTWSLYLSAAIHGGCGTTFRRMSASRTARRLGAAAGAVLRVIDDAVASFAEGRSLRAAAGGSGPPRTD